MTPEQIAEFITPEVAEALQSENHYCASRWSEGTPNGRAFNERSIDEWILYMEDYISEARTQAVRGDEEGALHTIRKVMNLGLNCMKQHGAPQREIEE